MIDSSKRLNEKIGPWGARVSLWERDQKGDPVYVGWRCPEEKKQRERSLRFHIRDPDTGEFLPEQWQKAVEIGIEISRILQEGRVPFREESPQGRRETDPEEVTLGMVTDAWIEHQKLDKSEGRAMRMQSTVDFLHNVLGREYPLLQFGPREWDAIRRQRISGELDCHGHHVPDEDKRRPVSPGSAGKVLRNLRQICRWATGFRTGPGTFLLSHDPTRGLEIPKNKSPRQVVCDDPRADALLATSGYVHWYLPVMLVLAYRTGARRGAIASLRWSDWRPNRGTHGSIRWRAESDKIGYERTVPVAPEVRLALEAHRERFPGIGDGWVFPAPDSEGPVRGDVMTQWLGKAERLAGLPHPKGFGWHSFRRMWVTKRKDLPDVDVAQAGGWRDTQTLRKCYQKPDPETMEQVVMAGRNRRLDLGDELRGSDVEQNFRGGKLGEAR